MRKLTAILVLALWTGALCAQQAKPKYQADEKTLKWVDAELQQFQDAWNRQDAQMCASYYAEDAELFLPGQPLIRGQENIRKAYRELLAGENFPRLSIAADSVLRSGDFLVESGHYSMSLPAQSEPFERGKYVTVLVRKGSGWKIIRDIFNSDAPPQTATQ